MRKKKKKNKLLPFLFVLVLIGAVGFGGYKAWNWFKRHRQLNWNGKAGYSLAIETKQKDILILSLIPSKKLATVIEVPGNTQIETPWFGKYLAEKLSLLSEQEQSRTVFQRSLSYSLGIPIDSEKTETSLSKNKQKWSSKLSSYFKPWWGVEEWYLWRYLRQRDLVWQEYSLQQWSEKKELPDGREFYDLNKELFLEEIGGVFTDIIVRREELPVSVFNIGQKEDLADQTADIIEQMGIRVVEIGDRDREINEGCLIVSNQENKNSMTVLRLRRVFGCQFLMEETDSLGEIGFYIKNVKI
jgi:hypothetical protein